MLKEGCLCPCRVDTFLWPTKIKPAEPEKARKTVAYKRDKIRSLGECLGRDMPDGFWG